MVLKEQSNDAVFCFQGIRIYITLIKFIVIPWFEIIAAIHNILYELTIFRFVEQCPRAFLEFSGCKTIIMSAIHAVSIPHSDANATVVRFLQTVIKLAQNKV